MTKKKKNYSFDFIEVASFLNRWRKDILIITIIATVCAIIASFIITPKFESTVIFYPTTTNSISTSILAEQSQSKKDPLEFGAEDEAEQLLQILNSDEMKSRVTKTFNLMDHYDIDSTDKRKFTKLGKTFDKNITFRRTPYSSIEIKVLDVNPKFAADLANGISSLLDTLKTEVQRRIARQAFDIVEQQYFRKLNEVTALKDSLAYLGSLGVFNVEEQSKAIMEMLVKARNTGKENEIRRVQDQADVLAKYGSAYTSWNETLVLELEKLSDLKKNYEEKKVDLEAQLSHKFLISSAYPAEVKSYPIRWLIVLVTAVSAFLLSCVVLLVLERVRYYKTASKDQLWN